MKKISIGITGATGSLGKEILKFKSFKFVKYRKDIRSKNDLVRWFNLNNFNAVIHLAAIVPIKNVNSNKKRAYNVNFGGTKLLVDQIKKQKINWFFFASTSHVYSSSKNKISENFKCKPTSYYGYTKKISENYIVQKLSNTKIKYCIGRIFSTSNKNQKVNYLVPDLKTKIKNKNNNKKIILENLNHYRDFISMKDISKIIFFLYKKKFSGIINLGTGKQVHLKEIAKIIAKKYKRKIYFDDNKKATYLIANISKLKKIYKKKLNSKMEKMIF